MDYKELLDNLVTSTDFELFHFVVGAQDSPHRVLRQINLEGNVREDSKATTERDLKRKKIELKKINRDIEKEQDELEKEILEIDKEEIEQAIINFEKRLEAINYEIGVIKNFYEKFREQVSDEDIKYLTDKENLYKIEGEYWTERLSRQASLDLVSTGRLGSGNVESMLNLPPELADSTLAKTFQRTQAFESKILPPNATVQNNPKLEE